MRTYGVVENDVDIEAIWATAGSLGFVDLKLAAYNVPPFHVSLGEYHDILLIGETYGRWAEWTRHFLNDARMFFLRKAGTEPVDSRRSDAVGATIEATITPQLAAHVTLRNTGRGRWLPSSEPFGGVSLGCHLFDADGALLRLEYARQPLPSPLAPGEETVLEFQLPPLDPGSYVIELDCVANQVTWFGQAGSPVTRVHVTVA